MPRQPKVHCDTTVDSDGHPRRRRLARLAALEGHHVSVALDDGSRIDDCQLVSGGRDGVETLWLFANGADRFVPLQRVLDVWEAPSPAAFCATRMPVE